jgi:hypothetical protein
MWHPVHYIVATPTRLALTAVAASGALVGLSLWLDWWIDTQSRSPGLNSVLFVAWLLLIFGVSFVEAFFLGDLVLPRGWRRNLMLARGQRARDGEGAASAPREGAHTADGADDDLEDEVVARRRLRSYTPHFSAILGLLVAGNALLVGELRSGVLWRIHDVQLESALRSDEPATRLWAIERVTRLGHEATLTHFTDRLVERMDDGDPLVARTAVQAVAHVARRMRASMEELRRVRSPQRWEKTLYERLQQTLAELLLARFRHRPELRPALAEALGALEVRDAVQSFETFLWQEQPDRDTVRAVVRAAGELGHLHALTVPLEVLTWDDEPLQAESAWALGEILVRYDPDQFTREPRCIGETVEALSTHLPKLARPGRCVLVEAFARVRDARTAGALFALFDAAHDDDACPRVEIDRRFGPPLVASREQPLRFKVVQAVAGIAAGNQEVIDWLERRLQRGDLSPRYQEALRSVLERARPNGVPGP